MDFFKKTWVIVVLFVIAALALEFTTGIFSKMWHRVKPATIPGTTPTVKK